MTKTNSLKGVFTSLGLVMIACVLAFVFTGCGTTKLSKSDYAEVFNQVSAQLTSAVSGSAKATLSTDLGLEGYTKITSAEASYADTPIRTANFFEKIYQNDGFVISEEAFKFTVTLGETSGTINAKAKVVYKNGHVDAFLAMDGGSADNYQQVTMSIEYNKSTGKINSVQIVAGAISNGEVFLYEVEKITNNTVYRLSDETSTEYVNGKADFVKNGYSNYTTTKTDGTTYDFTTEYKSAFHDM